MSARTMDERKGVPSASGIERLMLCPGSWAMEQKYDPEPPDTWAASGTKIHAALNGQPVELTIEEEETAEKCVDLERALIVKTFGTKPDLSSREIRLWLHDPATFDPLMSGKFDALHLAERHALIIDFKTGRNEVPETPTNKQLRALAVLVKEHFDVHRVTVALIQPWHSPQADTCDYSEPDLEKSKTELLTALIAAQESGAALRPGLVQCTHCRARAFCPSAWQEVDRLDLVLNPSKREMITGRDVAQLLDRWALCKKIGNAIEAHAKARLEMGEEIPGWRITEGKEIEEIINPQLVFNRCFKKGVSPEAFMGAVKILKGELKAVIKDATGTKGQKLDLELAKVLDGATESKTTAGSLARVKGNGDH